MYWLIMMESSFIIKLFNFFVNDTLDDYRQFTIHQFGNEGDEFSTFTSNIMKSSTLYYSLSMINTPTRAFIFSLTSASTNKPLTILLCEVEAIAECEEGTWGEHCESLCPKSCPDFCRFDDGLCNDGCLGYSDPPTCTKSCETGTWGLNCSKTCSNKCFNSSCDKVNGLCDMGCVGYSNPPYCTKGCTYGNSGINCTQLCTDTCNKSNCNAFSGECVQRCVGLYDLPNCSLACEEGWFGPECQYKCRCQQSCSPEGECPGLCEYGWFGYKCQYQRMSYKAITNNPYVDVTIALNDDNETTCIDIKAETVYLYLEGALHMPWIRLFTQEPESLHNLKISFLKKKHETIVEATANLFVAKDNMVDIYISRGSYFIVAILLQGSAIRQICSLWVIKGQNVATKQNVYYSDSRVKRIDTSLPKYPQASDGLYKCNENDTSKAGTEWKIKMEHSFSIKEFIFFVNYSFVSGEKYYYTIKMFDEDEDLYNIFTSNATDYLKLQRLWNGYGVPIKAFTFSLRSSSTNQSVALLLCEVEVYTECYYGTWGVHCKNKCNKRCPHLCRFDDGLCYKGCFGYSDPPSCITACEAGTWGFNCSKTCSSQCFNSSCDGRTGLCDRGCLGYSDPPHCVTACKSGTWGPNCRKTCSRQCFNFSCDSRTGLCDSGFDGHSDPTLSTIVTKESQLFSEQTTVAITVPITLAVLIAVIICFVVLRVKGKLCFERKENNFRDTNRNTDAENDSNKLKLPGPPLLTEGLSFAAYNKGGSGTSQVYKNGVLLDEKKMQASFKPVPKDIDTLEDQKEHVLQN
uniref:Uncharacterized protein n=1 Tax=Biomphalaria glabrata TaxID=6526 RepID=A0A2C9LPB6_BIOGL